VIRLGIILSLLRFYIGDVLMNKFLAILVALFAVNSFAQGYSVEFEYDRDGAAQCDYSMRANAVFYTCTPTLGWTIVKTELYELNGDRLKPNYNTEECTNSDKSGTCFALGSSQKYVVKVSTKGPKFIYDKEGSAQCVVVANGETADHIACTKNDGWEINRVVVKKEDGEVAGEYDAGDYSNIVFLEEQNFDVYVYTNGPKFVYEPEGSAQCKYVAANKTEGVSEHIECYANEGYKIEKLGLYDQNGIERTTYQGTLNKVEYNANYTYKVSAVCSDCYHVSRYSNDNVDYDINGEGHLVAEKGTKIEVTVTPKPGYEVNEITYKACSYDNFKWTCKGNTCSFNMPGCSVSLNADVSVINYSIVYNLDGATSNENPDAYKVTDGTVTLKNPVKSGYGFAGWYSDKDFTNKVEKLTIDKVQELAVDKKVTLYAMWDKLIVAENDCYKLSTADDLYQFAQVVAGSHKYIAQNQKACGSMQNDIVLNENVLAQFDETGNLKPDGDVSGFKTWTPIGYGASFLGKFYGNGHAVKGLYFDGSSEAGLFGYVGKLNWQKSDITVIIDGVGIEDSYMKAGVVGGVVGTAWHAEVTKSYNKGIMIGEKVGGIVGFAAGVKMKNCYNTGFLKGERVGGIVGDASMVDEVLKNSVVNSYNVGSLVSDSEHPHIGGIVGFKGNGTEYYPVLENSYFLAEDNEEDFHDGTVAIALHEGMDGSVWGQYVGHDELPHFDASGFGRIKFDITFVANGGTVAGGSTMQYEYRDTKKFPVATRDGYILAGWFENEDLSGISRYSIEYYEGITGPKTYYAKWAKVEDGCMLIADATDLYGFSNYVGTAEGDNVAGDNICAKLVADIVVNEKVLGEDGCMADNSCRVWTPVGYYNKPFRGTFDGRGHVIKGLFYDGDQPFVGGLPFVGLFGYVKGASHLVVEGERDVDEIFDSYTTISNVGVEDSYFKSVEAVAGIASYANHVNITNAYNASSVIGGDYIGGLVGSGKYVNITNAYNIGSISAAGNASGLVGASYDNDIRFFNSYSLTKPLPSNDENEVEGVVVADENDFKDGTVARKLHAADAIWAQDVEGGEEHPMLRTYRDYGAVVVALDNSTATIDGKSNVAAELDKDVVVTGDVTFNRAFAAGKYATIMLPFATEAKNIDGAKFYKFVGVADGQVQVTVASEIEAHTPYIVVTEADVTALTIKGGEDGVTLKKTVDASTKSTIDNWEFVGVYAYKAWADGDEELGTAYGFAGKEGNSVAIGTFGKIADGAYIYPMRGYLRYSAPAAKPAPAYAPAAGYSSAREAAARAQIELPDEMDVVIVGSGNDDRTVIGSLKTRTGEFRSNAADRWFDMRGRKLNGKPSVKGTYYKNGKIVIVK